MKTKTVYIPNQQSKLGFFSTIATIFRNAYTSKELIYQLYRRDFLMQYKKSFFGMGWMLFAPIMGVLSWVLMNSAGVLSPGDVGVPYPVYVLFGTSIWGLFMSFYTNSGLTLDVAKGFIQQVNFHHEALIFKQALQDLTNFSITIIINIIFMLAYGIVPSLYLFLLPLLLIPIFFIAASIGLFVAILSTVTTDVKKISTFSLTLLMFITPVIYNSADKEVWLQKLNLYNPLTYLITGPRDLVLFGTMDHPMYYLYAILLSILMFFVSLRFFYVAEKKVIEKMI